MAEIEFENITKSFNGVNVIENLNLKIKDGSFTVLVGESGCGKTTLLRILAGIGPATSGKILMDGEDISDVAPGKRGIAMVFQNYAIYPTMTVKENIEFGLKNNKVPKAERERLIEEVSRSVGLENMLSRKPGTLSGGQRQRIALARAMVKKPKVFLMDEPLSNLDAKLRVSMRAELIELHKRLGATFVYVTHDQTEAMSMADDIVLMEQGKIIQQDRPYEIYHNPNSVYTAQFIGSPAMNVFRDENQGYFGFRPEKCRLEVPENQSSDWGQYGEVVTREMLGNEYLYKLKCAWGEVMAKSESGCFDYKDPVYLSVAKEDIYFFDRDQRKIERRCRA